METINKKVKHVLYGLLIIGILGGTSACNNDRKNDSAGTTDTQMRNDGVGNDAEVMDTDENAWMRERDAFVANQREISTDMENKINKWERDAAQMSGKSQAAMKESINSLKTKRKTLDTKLNDLETSSRDSWQEMKNEVAEASRELEMTWDAFEKEHVK